MSILPEPVKAIKEFARLLKSSGHIIITAPFCSLTHFALYHFHTGFNRYFYEKHLPDNGFEIGQIEKYWGKLFTDPIKLTSSEGDSFLQPQRTNSIIEQFFRGIRRAHRRTTGNNPMCKKLQSMFADTLMAKNLIILII